MIKKRARAERERTEPTFSAVRHGEPPAANGRDVTLVGACAETDGVIDLAAAGRNQTASPTDSRSEFLANISHELRTPLNAIIGFSEIMSAEALGPIGNERYREYVRDINLSGQHLLEIINEILDYSKIEAGEYELQENDIDVADLCVGVGDLVRPQAAAAGVEVMAKLGPGLPTLRGDETKIRQMLLNLVANAIKFTPGQGQVTLRAAVDFDGTMTFAVTDTGIGIAAENIEKALTPYGQVDSGLDRKYQGTGLGLPLARTFAELHDAIFDLESEVGEGTTVSVCFPASRVID